MIVSNKVRPHGRLIATRLGLVVAMRLHTQLSLPWLHISSNTPSCSEEGHEWDPITNPIRHTLSILQFWFEKHLAEPAEFKAIL
jgi:hypothetical protein